MTNVKHLSRLLSGIGLFACFYSPTTDASAQQGPYTYSVVQGQAVITAFDASYTGSLLITNNLGGYPVGAIDAYAFMSRTNLASVTIPDSVTTIGHYAFAGCSGLMSVALGNCVTSIDEGAFARCAALDGVTLGNSVTSIGVHAFRFCGSLVNITLPDSVSSIGPSAFEGCTSLACMIVPNGVITISESTFLDCSGLIGVTLGSGVTTIGSSAFRGCTSLLSVTIPNSVTAIGVDAFRDCVNLLGVSLGSGLATIGIRAFSGCSSLGSIAIPDSVATIGQSAFSGSSLVDIMIPGSVTTIGSFAFHNCSSMVDIFVALNNPNYSSINGVLFNKMKTTLIEYPGGKTGAYIIPNGVVTIGNNAFRDCAKITAVIIPGSVTTIGDYAFSASSLTGLTLGNGVTTIGDGAFSWSDLESISIPDSVTSIGFRAFLDCHSLTNVTIGCGVTTIGDESFRRCFSLLDIVVAINNSNYSSIDGVLFNKIETTLIQYPGGKTRPYSIPGGVTTIASYAFGWCNVTRVTIPDNVTTIGSYAFSFCGNLSRVYFTGNAPAPATLVFFETPAAVYYLPGATGWGADYSGHPAILWNPAFTAFGIESGAVSSTVTGTPGIPITVDVSTNLISGQWISLFTTNITSGTLSFHDSDATDYPTRFYRISAP